MSKCRKPLKKLPGRPHVTVPKLYSRLEPAYVALAKEIAVEFKIDYHIEGTPHPAYLGCLGEFHFAQMFKLHPNMNRTDWDGGKDFITSGLGKIDLKATWYQHTGKGPQTLRTRYNGKRSLKSDWYGYISVDPDNHCVATIGPLVPKYTVLYYWGVEESKYPRRDGKESYMSVGYTDMRLMKSPLDIELEIGDCLCGPDAGNCGKEKWLDAVRIST